MTYLQKTLIIFVIAIFNINISLAATGDRIGVVGAVNKNLSAISQAGDSRDLNLGDNIMFKDVVKTDELGNAQLLFVDKSALTVGSNSSVTIDEFVYNPKTNNGNLVMQGTKGTFRFIGGALSKKNAVKIKTPVGTIGIRGGIAVVQIDPTSGATNATFVYGDMLTFENMAGQVQTVNDSGLGLQVDTPTSLPTVYKASIEQTMNQVQSLSGKSGTSAGAKQAPSEKKIEEGVKVDEAEKDSSASDDKGAANKENDAKQEKAADKKESGAEKQKAADKKDSQRSDKKADNSDRKTQGDKANKQTDNNDSAADTSENGGPVAARDSEDGDNPRDPKGGNTAAANNSGSGEKTTANGTAPNDRTATAPADRRGLNGERRPVSGKNSGLAPTAANGGLKTDPSRTGGTYTADGKGGLAPTAANGGFLTDPNRTDGTYAADGKDGYIAPTADNGGLPTDPNRIDGTYAVNGDGYVAPTTDGGYYTAPNNTAGGYYGDATYDNPDAGYIAGTDGGYYNDPNGVNYYESDTYYNDPYNNDPYYNDPVAGTADDTTTAAQQDSTNTTSAAAVPASVGEFAKYLTENYDLSGSSGSGNYVNFAGTNTRSQAQGFMSGFVTKEGHPARAYRNRYAHQLEFNGLGGGISGAKVNLQKVGGTGYINARFGDAKFGTDPVQNPYIEAQSGDAYALQQAGHVNNGLHYADVSDGVLIASQSLNDGNSNVQCTTCQYVHWGVWAAEVDKYAGGASYIDTANLLPYISGQITDNASIPTTGSATYSGITIGHLSNGSGVTAANGAMNAVIDFYGTGAKIQDGNFSANLGSYNLTNHGDINFGGGASFSDFGVEVNGSGVVDGNMSGALFGPGAAELGGNYEFQSGGTQGTGVYLGSQ